MEMSLTSSFQLPGNFGIEISGFFLTPTVWGIAQSKPFGTLNVGVQKEFTNNGGVLRLSVGDLFWTGNWRSYANVPEQNLVYEDLYRFSERVFRLSYSNSFGNRKIRSARYRSTGAEEERNRVN